MTKTYLVTKTDFDSAIGVDDTAGLRSRIATNETAVGNETSGLVKKTNDIESSVGATAAEGLRKRTADLEGVVGLDDSSGLRKDMIDAKADIGADDTTGLRKRSADLETTVGTDDTKGLRKRTTDLESSVGVDDASGLRKKVVDMANKPVAAWDVDEVTDPTNNIGVQGVDIDYFLGGMTRNTTTKTVTVPLDGLYRVSISAMIKSSTVNEGASLSITINIDGVRYHTIRAYSNTVESYKLISGSVILPVNSGQSIAMVAGGDSAVYGSGGDYTSCAIEYVRPLTD